MIDNTAMLNLQDEELRGLKAQNGKDNVFYEAAMCSHKIQPKVIKDVSVKREDRQ